VPYAFCSGKHGSHGSVVIDGDVAGQLQHVAGCEVDEHKPGTRDMNEIAESIEVPVP
jgi:hypothetical protein